MVLYREEVIHLLNIPLLQIQEDQIPTGVQIAILFHHEEAWKVVLHIHQDHIITLLQAADLPHLTVADLQAAGLIHPDPHPQVHLQVLLQVLHQDLLPEDRAGDRLKEINLYFENTFY